MKPILIFLGLALLAAGCATPKPRPAPLLSVDVISMVKAGATDEEIMRRIDSTGTVFNLNADDVVLLRKEGVSDRVVTYMLDTKTRAAVEEQRRRDVDDVRWHYGIGFGFGRHCW